MLYCFIKCMHEIKHYLANQWQMVTGRLHVGLNNTRVAACGNITDVIEIL